MFLKAFVITVILVGIFGCGCHCNDKKKVDVAKKPESTKPAITSLKQ